MSKENVPCLAPMASLAGADPVALESDATTEYHCTAEWHLGSSKSKFTTPLYGFALRLSAKSGSFFCSQLHLAEYFQCSPRSIWAAIRELQGSGFFLLISSSPFQTNVYRVLDHQAWIEKHPGRCTTRFDFSWSKGEEIGRRLYAISGGRVKLRPEQIRWLKGKFAAEEIEKRFRRLLATPPGITVDAGGFMSFNNVNWDAL